MPSLPLPLAFGLVAASLLLCCDRPPSASSLPEWTAADHDRVEESARAGSPHPPVAPAPNQADAGRSGAHPR